MAAGKINNPLLTMMIVQACFAVMSFMTEASFRAGLNTFVFVSARHLLVAGVLSPLCCFYERTRRPKMTIMLFLEISVLSALGVSVGPNLYFASLKYTSATFVTSMINTVPSITFLISILLRKEEARKLKIAGIAISLAGATVVSLYKGPGIAMKYNLISIQETKQVHEDWVKGIFLAIASCITWSAWFVMQDYTMKRYPAILSLATWMCFIGGLQSAVYTLITQRREEWLIGHGLSLSCIIYSGIICNGFTFVAQLWCTKVKGAVFVTIFDPIAAILVVLASFFIFGQTLYIGSVIGGIAIIAGIYILLWAKNKEQRDGEKELPEQRDGAGGSAQDELA